MAQTDQLAINRIAQSLEDIAKNGGGSGGGGDTVSITPTLEEGTKIAEFSINGESGELYAPAGGSGGGSQYRTLASIDVPENASYSELMALIPTLTAVFEGMTDEQIYHTKLLRISELEAEGISMSTKQMFQPIQVYKASQGDLYVNTVAYMYSEFSGGTLIQRTLNLSLTNVEEVDILHWEEAQIYQITEGSAPAGLSRVSLPQNISGQPAIPGGEPFTLAIITDLQS